MLVGAQAGGDASRIYRTSFLASGGAARSLEGLLAGSKALLAVPPGMQRPGLFTLQPCSSAAACRCPGKLSPLWCCTYGAKRSPLRF